MIKVTFAILLLILTGCSKPIPPKYSVGDTLCAGDFKGKVVDFHPLGYRYRFISPIGKTIWIKESSLSKCED